MRGNRSTLLPPPTPQNTPSPSTKRLFNCTGMGEEKRNWAICTLESKHTHLHTHVIHRHCFRAKISVKTFRRKALVPTVCSVKDWSAVYGPCGASVRRGPRLVYSWGGVSCRPSFSHFSIEFGTTTIIMTFLLEPGFPRVVALFPPPVLFFFYFVFFVVFCLFFFT